MCCKVAAKDLSQDLVSSYVMDLLGAPDKYEKFVRSNQDDNVYIMYGCLTGIKYVYWSYVWSNMIYYLTFEKLKW